MSTQSQLLDMILKCEDLQVAGQPVSPEEICRQRPDLLPDLEKHLRALDEIELLLQSEDLASHADARPANASTSARWPAIPGYEILAEIGQGGMGIVYRARQAGLDRLVAIKTIKAFTTVDTEQVHRFMQEARAMALLQHPNVIQVHEIGEYDGRPYLVMEYVAAGNLSQNLERVPMAPRKAAELVASLAHGVHAAHQQGIIHRDLKPANILLAPSGAAKIGDFGLAKWFQLPSEYTQTGQLLGTPSYMAPEQILTPHAPMGPAVDVYALGAILYELLTGHPPFLADNPLDTLLLVSSQDPVPPRRWQPKTPRDLETICLKCLEKNPSRRYASAQDLADDLQSFLAGRPICARPVGWLERAWRWARVHPSTAALIAVAVLSLTTLLAMFASFHQRLYHELQQTSAEHQQVLETRGRLHQTLAQEVAGQLDSDLRELEAVPSTVATMLARGTINNEEHLARTLGDLLGRTPRIFGMCVAMEPYAWQADREHFALYVYRKPQGLAVRQLLPPLYQPAYRQWPWYASVQGSSQGQWTEPYLGEGADRTPMVTYSAPIWRDGRFLGVVTADLATEYFKSLRDNIDRLDFGGKGYGVVLTPAGQILAHPDDRYEFPGPNSDVNRLPAPNPLRDLARQALRQPDATADFLDPASGQPQTARSSRIASPGWTFLLVQPR